MDAFNYASEPVVEAYTVTPTIEAANMPSFPADAGNPFDNRITELMVTITVLITVSAMVVFARISARTVFAGGLGWDDWTILIALFLSGGQAACNYLSIQAGFLGRHIWEVQLTAPELIQETKVGYASQLIYCSALYFTRISIVIFLYRLFPSPKNKITHYSLGGTITITWIAQLFALAFQCKFPHWQFLRREGECVDQEALYLANASVGILLDFLLLITPIFWISRLNLEKRHKIALIFVFAMGVFVCIAGIIRLTTLDGAVVSDDVSWYASATANWSQVEVNVGIICASLPSLKPLFRSFFGEKRMLSLSSTDSEMSGRVAVMIIEKEAGPRGADRV